jgi:hypothetical protein
MPKVEGTFKPPSLRVSRTKTPKNSNPSQPKTLPKKPSGLDSRSE